jgi:polyhydroxyalkanoate synthesis regulator phasin
MCDKHASNVPCPADGTQSSRRRRVWELSHACHCPLVGVGLPLGGLRKLVEKVTGGKVLHDDYDIHVGTVSECALRTPVADAVQKELERRYAQHVQRFRAAKTTEQVEAMWDAAVAAGDVAGAFWAGLSHPRCSAALEEKMCRDIHMVQHQAGACARADINKFNAVVADNARLEREVARLQERCNALGQEKALESERLENQLRAARAATIARDGDVQALRAELARLQASIPDLESRERLAERVAQVEAREQALRAQLAELKAARAPAPAPEAETAPEPIQVAPVAMPVRLENRSVLCVGGRSSSVPIYRNMIERVGAQFAHHDGGLEDSSSQLDASLAAADLVICQTGCISHSAYWRVKDHCKRHGKRCVFVDNPSVSSLVRGLQEAATEDQPG